MPLKFLSADDWADDGEEEEDDDDEEEEEGEEGEATEMKATVKKKVAKTKEKKAPTQKKAHMNIIFIGHVGKSFFGIKIQEASRNLFRQR